MPARARMPPDAHHIAAPPYHRTLTCKLPKFPRANTQLHVLSDRANRFSTLAGGYENSGISTKNQQLNFFTAFWFGYLAVSHQHLTKRCCSDESP
jgi:hypothetical protein